MPISINSKIPEMPILIPTLNKITALSKVSKKYPIQSIMYACWNTNIIPRWIVAESAYISLFAVSAAVESISAAIIAGGHLPLLKNYNPLK